MKSVFLGSFLVTLLIIVASEPEDSIKEKISILKCCRFMEHLVRENEKSPPKCVPTRNQWQPFIYSVKQGKKVTEIPNKWNITEGQKPQCPKSHVLNYIPYNPYSPFILTDTGAAILEVGSGRNLNPEEYCADSNALLVCELNYTDERAASTMRPSIRRCCGSHAAYDENRYLLIGNCFSSSFQYISLEFNPNTDHESHTYTHTKLQVFCKLNFFPYARVLNIHGNKFFIHSCNFEKKQYNQK